MADAVKPSQPPSHHTRGLLRSVAGCTLFGCALGVVVLLSPSTSAVTRLQLLALPASELRHLTPPKNITTGPDAVAFKEQWAGYLPIKGSSTDGVHVLVLDPALSTPVELPPNAWVLPTEGSTQRRDVDAASTMIEHPAAPVRSVNPLTSPVPLAPPPSAPPPWWITDSKRAARAKNVSLVPTSDAAGGRWAYEVLDPRPGTVLLSAGQSASGQPYLEDAAVLLVHVCACHPAVFGVLLSAPTASLMGGEFCPTARAHYPAFVNHTIHMGGPVGPHWTVLHSFPTCVNRIAKLAPQTRTPPLLAEPPSVADSGSVTDPGSVLLRCVGGAPCRQVRLYCGASRAARRWLPVGRTAQGRGGRRGARL